MPGCGFVNNEHYTLCINNLFTNPPTQSPVGYNYYYCCFLKYNILNTVKSIPECINTYSQHKPFYTPRLSRSRAKQLSADRQTNIVLSYLLEILRNTHCVAET